jgi:hypothetical protein
VTAEAPAPDRLVVRRGRFVVLVNLGAEPADFDLDGGEVVLAWDRVDSVGGRVRVPADDVAVLRTIAT